MDESPFLLDRDAVVAARDRAYLGGLTTDRVADLLETLPTDGKVHAGLGLAVLIEEAVRRLRESNA